MKYKILHIILYFLILAANSVYPQNNDVGNKSAISTFNMFREPSYISILGGVGNIEPLIFEGDLVTNFMLSLKRDARWGIQLSPRIIIRMYNEKSYPVRTPSYMPRVTFFYQLINDKDKKKDVSAYFALCHHSNGQNGSFYLNNSDTINLESGSFSTNFFEGGVFLSRPDKKELFFINYFKFSVLYHFNQDQDLENLYGRWRFFVDYKGSLNYTNFLSLKKNKSVYNTDNSNILSHTINIGWIAGDLADTYPIDLKRLIFKYTLLFKPYFMDDVNFFAQYYYGPDYYNIYFNRNLSILRFGISAKTPIFR